MAPGRGGLYADRVTTSKPALALYLHIPFCTAKCGYCDFNSYEGLGHLVPDYTPALIRELQLWAPAARAHREDDRHRRGGGEDERDHRIDDVLAAEVGEHLAQRRLRSGGFFDRDHVAAERLRK